MVRIAETGCDSSTDREQVSSHPSNISELRKKHYDSRIIIAGTRGFSDVGWFRKTLTDYLVKEHKGKHIAFISGDAPSGADNLIIKWCELTPFECYKFTAKWNELGKRAGFLRNDDMSYEASHLLTYWDGQSPGTKDMIKRAEERGLIIHNVNIKL
ncbi:MAG: SLOG family protein [Gammaproteobacteria bacterium]|nr:SLOG family protein [Acholeplasmataceae bacterium]MCK9529037.1 SLOG family protein [Gammaproteobacteria bacterium]